MNIADGDIALPRAIARRWMALLQQRDPGRVLEELVEMCERSHPLLFRSAGRDAAGRAQFEVGLSGAERIVFSAVGETVRLLHQLVRGEVLPVLVLGSAQNARGKLNKAANQVGRHHGRLGKYLAAGITVCADGARWERPAGCPEIVTE